MPKGLDIRRRIKSVKNIRSITKAMEMVAASKMRKAQDQALRTRSYAEQAGSLLASVAGHVRNFEHYLFTKPAGQEVLVLIVSTNKGLCGSLNTNLLRKLGEHKRAHPEQHLNFVTLGKKGRDSLLRMKETLQADFSDATEKLSFASLSPLTKHLLDEYRSGKYSHAYVLYTHFVSVLKQKPTMKRIAPLDTDLLATLQDESQQQNTTENFEYTFEPSPAEVLTTLLPRLVEIQIYQAILEAYASEQSSRMLAMKNAEEAAGDLISDLTLSFNKMRQSAITQEISEIVGGVEALSKAN